MPVPSGTRLGRYEIRALLGAGGMGEVYRAHDTTLHRDVAVKVLPTELEGDPDRLRRIEQEAHAASSLNHPNILTVHEIGRQDRTLFVATEFIEGESLRERLDRHGLELWEALDIGEQLASALGAAHAAGIVHRDIKPENIMIRKDGIVKVLDFGLAKFVNAGAAASDAQTVTIPAATVPGFVLGTPNYLSPEQARGLAIDSRTDIWSLGVVLYELLCGRVPFQERTTSDVIAAILRSEPAPLTMCAPGIPAELERIVSKALRKNRDERYQAVKDLGLDLKALRRQIDFEAERARRSDSAELAGPEMVGATRRRRNSRARLAIATLVTSTTLAALAYGGYIAFIAGPRGADIDSVAVLPFINETGDSDNEYLSDGITVALINSLSELPGVKVIARSSAFKYKGKDADPQEVARALGIDAIVTGRLTQRADRVLIAVELVNAVDRTHLWGDQYYRNAADLLQVQADISAEIADKLRSRLTASDRERVTKRQTTSLQAYDVLLRGRFYFDKGGTQNRKRAVEYFKQAIAIDANYAAAYATLSNAYRTLVFSGVLAPQEFLSEAEKAARKSLDLDAGLAEGHDALSSHMRATWNWSGADRESRRAILLNANLASAHGGRATFLSLMGRHDEAIAEAQRALELDPLSGDLTTRVVMCLLFARRYDRALEAAAHAIEVDPGNSVAFLFRGYAYAAKGSPLEAIKAYEDAIRVGDETPSTQLYLGAAYAQSGRRAAAEAILKRLQADRGTYVSPGELPVLLSALGRTEEAFASLERAFAVRDVQLGFLGVDPALDGLRGDPRFAALIRRVGLPQ